MNLTLETRKPSPLAEAGYRELANVLPAVGEAVYFADATRAAESVGRVLPHLAANGADHWVPSDVFARLAGGPFHGGSSKVYRSAGDAAADLAAAWKAVRGV